MKVPKIMMALALRSQGHSQTCAGNHVGWSHRATVFRCLVRASDNRAVKQWEARPEQSRRLALEAVKDAKCVCKVSPSPEEQARQKDRRKDAAKRGARTRAMLKDVYPTIRAIREGTGINFREFIRYGKAIYAYARVDYMCTKMTIEGSMVQVVSYALGDEKGKEPQAVSADLADPKFFDKVIAYYQARLAQHREHLTYNPAQPVACRR